ncbi:hypothetical protein BH23GEM3_BH23GEM3_25690 [soil metagenome]
MLYGSIRALRTYPVPPDTRRSVPTPNDRPTGEDPPRAASAARRATADADVFLIPTEQLPPGFAERLDDAVSEAPAPRAAATVVLVRENGGRLEVLLLLRPRRSRFAADAWVFPGGAVDAADSDPVLQTLADGPSPAAWARRMVLRDPREAFGYAVAALREAWEETGILLARPLAEAPESESLAEARRAVLAGEMSLLEVAKRERLRLALDEFLYIAHWITPEPEPRRYDTRFFLAPVTEALQPAGTLAAGFAPHEPELVEARWMTATDAVEGFRTATMTMLPPTVHTLRRLAGFGSIAELRDGLADAPVPAILPRMRRHAEGVAIEIGNDTREEGRGKRKE